MIPPSLMTAGNVQTLVDIRRALEERVMNTTNRLSATPSFHRGTPDPTALPDEALGVWLDWTDIGKDPDEPMRTTMLMSTWVCYIITKDEGSDAFGGDSDLGMQIWGDILTTLTKTVTDIGLDGTLDFIPTPGARHFKGAISGGNRITDVIQMSIICRMSQELEVALP